MFDRREHPVRLPAVAETGKIHAAADRRAMTRPALSRTVARLEQRFGGRLFERLPTGSARRRAANRPPARRAACCAK